MEIAGAIPTPEQKGCMGKLTEQNAEGLKEQRRRSALQ
jgi:hypothetical protein